MSFNMFATLNFKAPGAESKMKSLQKNFKQMKASANTVGRGFSNVGEGVRGLALATAPVGIALGSAVNQAAKFEHSLSAVQSILRVTDDEMKTLAATTKSLGATTIFTSSEVNRGAQLFAQAGFTMEETMAGLPGVLDAAAAGEISVAQATNLVTSNLRAFSMEASDATKVADIMAETAALTNTNMLELGEGLKLSAAKAKGLGFSLSQTAAAIGVISNVGVKGSLSGTALRNALQKLSKPSEETTKMFGKLGVIVEDTNGKLLPMSEIFTRMNQAIGTNKSSLEGARKAVELFGIRGEVAFGAFREQASKTFMITEDNVDRFRVALSKTNSTMKASDIQIGKTIPHLVALDLAIQASEGSSNRMAKIRLDNFTGQVMLLSSAFNNVQLEIGSLLLDDLKDGATFLTDALSLLSLGFRSLDMKPEAFSAALDVFNLSGNMFADMVPEAKAFAEGFREGFKEIMDGAKAAFEFIRVKFNEFKESTGFSAKDLGKFAAQFLLIGAIAAPILIGIVAAMFVVGQVANGVLGVFQLFSGVFGMIKSGFLMLGKAKAFLSAAGVFKAAFIIPLLKVIAIIAILTVLWINFKDKFIASGKRIIEFFIPTFDRIKNKFNELFTGSGGEGFTQIFEDIKSVAVSTFNVILGVIGTVIDILSPIVEGFFFIFAVVFDSIVMLALSAFEGIVIIVKDVFGTVSATLKSMFADFDQIFADIGEMWTDLFGDTDGMSTFTEIVTTAFQMLGAVIGAVFDVIGIIFRVLLVVLITGIKYFLFIFSTIFKTITSIVAGVVRFIKDAFNGGVLFGSFMEIVGRLGKFIKETFTVMVQGFKEGGVLQGLTDAFTFAIDGIMTAFTEMGPKLFAIFTTIFTKLKKLSVSTVDAIGSGLRNAFSFILGDDAEGNKRITPAKTQSSGIIGADAGRKLKGAADANAAAQKANTSAKQTDKVNNGSGFFDKITDAIKGKDKDANKPIVVNSTLKCDGQVLARSVSKANVENSERQGGKIDCFKRGLVERAPAAG